MNNYTKYHQFLKSKSFQGDEKEFLQYQNYFQKNYTSYLPQKKDAQIIDVGCGMGHFLKFLKSAGYSNTQGIDFDPDNIQYCKQIGLKNVTQADMYQYFNKRQKFDCIVLNDVLEHIPRDKTIALLKKFKASLTKDGVLLVKTVNCNNIYGISSYFADFTHEVGYTKEKITQVGLLAGFAHTKVNNLYVVPNIVLIDSLLIFFHQILYKWKQFQFLLQGRKHNTVFSKNLLGRFYV